MEKENQKRPDELLKSIEAIQRAPAPDFFYTRLKARMEKQEHSARSGSVILRPAFIISGLVLLVLFNVMMFFKYNDSNPVISNKDNDSLQTIATAYHINDILPEELNQ